MDHRGTLTRAELDVLRVVAAAEPDGAALAAETRPDLLQVESTTARRLAGAGMVTIAGATATAHLTDKAAKLMGPTDA